MLFELNAFFASPPPCLLLCHGHVKWFCVSLKVQSAEQVIINWCLWCCKLNALPFSLSVWAMFDYSWSLLHTHIKLINICINDKNAFQTEYWPNKFALQQQRGTSIYFDWLYAKLIFPNQKQTLSRAMIVMFDFCFSLGGFWQNKAKKSNGETNAM